MTSLGASSGKQIASWDEKARHGLFTHHLLDALHGAGDRDGDGRVTAQEAKSYLDRHMTRAARREYRRVQYANLIGPRDVVLVSASGGSFPARPELDDPDPEPGAPVRSERRPDSAELARTTVPRSPGDPASDPPVETAEPTEANRLPTRPKEGGDVPRLCGVPQDDDSAVRNVRDGISAPRGGP